MRLIKILTPTVVFLMLLSLAGCNKDVLELSPPSTLTEADFYKTAQDMESAVLGVYNAYQTRRPTDWALMELPSDNLHRTGYSSIAGSDEINTLTFSPENPLFSNFWTSTYNGIFRANAVLAHIETPSDYSENQKVQLVGQAKFMRALFYFDLVRSFGGVPLITTLLSIDDARTEKRASESEVYALIIQDLNDAISVLPEKGVAVTGRASKGAALALLAKVQVYLKDWVKAKEALDQLTSSSYALLPDFASLWDEKNEDNNEVVFAIKYTQQTNGHVLSTVFLPYFGVSGISPQGGEQAFPSWSLHKLYEQQDTRKEVSIKERWKSPGSSESEPEIWFPYVNKFAIPHTPNSSGLDLYVIRYADVVLLAAEVNYQLNNIPVALDYLNQVRSRAFGNSDHNYSLAEVSGEGGFLDKLFLERRLELAFENERWFDLVRSGKYLIDLTEVETYYNPSTETSIIVKLNPKSNYKYFPIPLSEIEKVGTDVLVQNEGY